MGFLDEVKRKQAQERGAVERGAKPSRDSGLSSHVLQVEPHLALLRDGLSEFAQRLNAAPPDITTTYDIEGYGPLGGLRQSSYKLEIEDANVLTFSFVCRGEGNVEFDTDSRDSCDRILNHMMKNGLRVTYRSHADWKFVFSVEPFVPVLLHFEPHETDPVVNVKLQNLDHIGVKLERLKPERLDETFLEHLKKCVLREPNRFNELCGLSVSEDMRAELKERLAARKRAEGAPQPTTPIDEDQGPSGLRGLLGKLGKKR